MLFDRDNHFNMHNWQKEPELLPPVDPIALDAQIANLNKDQTVGFKTIKTAIDQGERDLFFIDAWAGAGSFL